MKNISVQRCPYSLVELTLLSSSSMLILVHSYMSNMTRPCQFASHCFLIRMFILPIVIEVLYLYFFFPYVMRVPDQQPHPPGPQASWEAWMLEIYHSAKTEQYDIEQYKLSFAMAVLVFSIALVIVFTFRVKLGADFPYAGILLGLCCTGCHLCNLTAY